MTITTLRDLIGRYPDLYHGDLRRTNSRGICARTGIWLRADIDMKIWTHISMIIRTGVSGVIQWELS